MPQSFCWGETYLLGHVLEFNSMEEELSPCSEREFCFVLMLIGNEAKSNMFEIFCPKRAEEDWVCLVPAQKGQPGTWGPFLAWESHEKGREDHPHRPFLLSLPWLPVGAEPGLSALLPTFNCCRIARYKTEHTVKVKFQINNDCFFRISMSQILLNLVILTCYPRIWNPRVF